MVKSNVTLSVFTSPTCPHCPSAVKLANDVGKELNAKVITYSAATREGQEEAQRQEIMSVPTILVKGDAYDKNIGFKGTPFKTDLVNAIKIARGEAEFPKQVSLLKKIQDKLGIKI